MDLFRRLFNQPGQQPDSKPEEAIIPATSAATPSAEPVVEAEASAVEVTRPRNTVADGATRPLPPLETAVATSSDHLIFGQSTDVGMVRSNNQDSMLSFFSTSRSADTRPDFGLFVVADGMGGHHDGEKASAMSVRTLAATVMSNVYLPLLTNDGTERPPISESMVNAVKKANEDVVAAIPEGGTTLTAVAVIGDLAYVVHVGDSRAYLITDNEIEQVTRDHSLVQRLVELDQLTQEETLEHPQRNVLYRALGQSESLEVDTLTRRLPPNSRLLLCSDGLWNQISEREIAEIVRTHTDPQEACDKLVALANAHGGADNITAVLLHIPQ